MKEIVIFGGPNGAGKTTAARILLRERVPVDSFLNADEIARAISPQGSEAVAFEAGRLMLERMRQLVLLDRSFAFETMR